MIRLFMQYFVQANNIETPKVRIIVPLCGNPIIWLTIRMKHFWEMLSRFSNMYVLGSILYDTWLLYEIKQFEYENLC